MRHAGFQLTAAFALALVAAVSVPAQSAPDAAMLKPVQRWIDAYNAGAALAEDIFSDDVVITDASAASVTVPVHNENGVLLVDATLDGRRPLLFTLDPGASDLYTRDARALLNGHAPKNVCLSSACFTANMQYFDADPAQLYPQHDPSLGAIGGSIGPALLHSYVAEINYRASTLTLIAPAHFAAPAGVQPLALRSDSSGMPVVAASVDGNTASFELDVRAPTSMLFTPFLNRTGLGGAYASAAVVKKSMFVAHSVRRVQISGVELHGVPFWFSTASQGKFAADDVAGLLGNNVLSHFVVTLDMPHRRAYFMPDAAPSQ